MSVCLRMWRERERERVCVCVCLAIKRDRESENEEREIRENVAMKRERVPVDG